MDRRRINRTARGGAAAILLTVLAGCGTTPVQSAGPTGAAQVAAAAPYTVPMDPATIGCADIAANTSARAEAVEWTLGRLRADLMSGRRTNLPDSLLVGDALETACRAAPEARLGQVAAGLSL